MILTIISLAMLAMIVFEVLQGTSSVLLVLNGILTGLVVGIQSNVSSELGQRNWQLYWAHRFGWCNYSCLLYNFHAVKDIISRIFSTGDSLFVIILSITAGTVINRVMDTRWDIKKGFKVWKIL